MRTVRCNRFSPTVGALVHPHRSVRFLNSTRGPVGVSTLQSVPALLMERARSTPNLPAISRPKVERSRAIEWDTLTWAGYAERVSRLAGGLRQAGLAAGQTFALCGTTQADWLAMDMAALGLGAVTMPLYEVMRPEMIAELLRRARSSGFFCSEELLRRLSPHLTDLPHLRFLVSSAKEPPRSDLRSFSLIALEEMGRGREGLFAEAAAGITRVQDAMIYHTSGTSGEMKPVPLTHGNLLATLEAITYHFGHRFDESDVLFSVLPHAHIYGRIEGLAQVAFGFQGFFLDCDYQRRGPYLAQVRPTLLFSVPLGLERAATRLRAEVNKLRGLRNLFPRQMARLGLRHLSREGIEFRLRDLLLNPIFERAVFRALREKAFGGRLRTVVSAGAYLPPAIAFFFHRLGLEVINGYGLTETAGPITVTSGKKDELYSVGQPMRGTLLEVDDDGSIRVKGPSVFGGYRYFAGETLPGIEQPFDDQGYYQTGDLGEESFFGDLFIVGRSKDLIILENGENVAPQAIENQFSGRSFFEHVVAVGHQRPWISLLVTLDRSQVEGIIQNGQSGEAPKERLRQAVQREIDAVNLGLAQHERIGRFAILDTPFSVDDDTLTPSMKVKRRTIEERHADAIAGLYA